MLGECEDSSNIIYSEDKDRQPINNKFNELGQNYSRSPPAAPSDIPFKLKGLVTLDVRVPYNL